VVELREGTNTITHGPVSERVKYPPGNIEIGRAQLRYLGVTVVVVVVSLCVSGAGVVVVVVVSLRFIWSGGVVVVVVVSVCFTL
jgi:hypothetical protein